MTRAALFAVLVVTITEASADCPKTPRLVFDPPGSRHGLPQLSWNGTRYAIVGYDGPPTHLVHTTFDFAKEKPRSLTIGPGGVAATAASDTQLAIAYLGMGAIVPRDATAIADKDPDFLHIDGRRVHAPRKDRYQSFFTVVDRSGATVVAPIPLGDQRVMHSAPGVSVAWNPLDREWGVVWNEFNRIMFGRISSAGVLVDKRKVVVDGHIHASSRMAWNGAAYAFLVEDPKGLAIYEGDAGGIRATSIPLLDRMYEAVLATDNGNYAIAYRIATPGKQLAPPAGGGRGGAPSPPPDSLRPPDDHELRVVTVMGGTVGKPVTIAKTTGGPTIETPVIAVDGKQLVVVWGEGRSAVFDARLKVARVDSKGKLVAGYPKRLDPENVHQGSASIAGTGCDLAVAYILGDPNAEVRIGVTRAP